MTKKEFIYELENLGYEKTTQELPTLKLIYDVYNIIIYPFNEWITITFPMNINGGRYTYSGECDELMNEILKQGWYNKSKVRNKKIEEILNEQM